MVSPGMMKIVIFLYFSRKIVASLKLSSAYKNTLGTIINFNYNSRKKKVKYKEAVKVQ